MQDNKTPPVKGAEGYNQIKELPPELVRQIAAGEVVERPASAIKELIDNSIDAQASKIQVNILSNDGRSFRITDDGIGIPRDQIDNAFKLHATSKISSLEDLNKIFTKGFRGEALSTISSVAEVICTTKYIEESEGTKATFDKTGNLEKTIGVIEQGTSIEIFNLFQKVPARLKFLKKADTEIQAISDMVKQLAIAHPNISLELVYKNKLQFKTSGSGASLQTIQEVFGIEIPFKYAEAEKEEPPLKLSGYIAPLSYSRSDAKSIVTIVNQRPIYCSIMRKAIKEAYSGILPKNRNPAIILFLEVPVENIDVNVHPTKKEVRYMHGSDIYFLTKRLIEKHLVLNAGIYEEGNTFPENENQIFREPKVSLLEESMIYRQILPSPENSSSNSIVPFQRVGVEQLEQGKTQVKHHSSPLQDFFDADLPEINFENKFVKSSKPVEETKGFSKNINFNVYNLKIKKIEENIKNKPIRIENPNQTQIAIPINQDYVLQAEIHSNEKWIRELLIQNLHNFISELTQKLELFSEINTDIQLRNIETQSHSQDSKRPYLNTELKEIVWKRDGWRCVYCGKYLLHPDLVKKSIELDPDTVQTKLDSNQKLYTINLYKEHLATIDHLLPHSHVPALSSSEENLHACCTECNQSKNNSTNYQKWQPQRYIPWINEKIQIGKIVFTSGDMDLGKIEMKS